MASKRTKPPEGLPQQEQQLTTQAPPRAVTMQANGQVTENPLPDVRTFVPPKVRAQVEYVAGSRSEGHNGPWALPLYSDDVEREVGTDTYEKMLNDPDVWRAYWLLVFGASADGLQFTARVTDEDAPDYEEAKTYAEFVKRAFERMDTDMRDVVQDMLTALFTRYRVAEIIYEYMTTGEDAGRLTLKQIKPKPRRTAALVVDPFDNIIGCLYAPAGTFRALVPQNSGGPLYDLQHVLPVEKFMVLSFFPMDGAATGGSLFRPAYNAWALKQRLYPRYDRMLAKHAEPSLFGTTSPRDEEQAKLDDAGNPVLDAETGDIVYQSPEERYLAEIIKFQGGTAMVAKDGAKLEVMEGGQGSINVFQTAFDFATREITKSLLFQTLATDEAAFGTRAQSQTHMQVLDLLIWAVKQRIVGCVDRYVVRPLVRMNFGDEAVALRPTTTLGDTERRDFAKDAGAWAALAGAQLLHPSQYPAMDAQLGLPPRDAESSEADQLAVKVAEGTEAVTDEATA